MDIDLRSAPAALLMLQEAHPELIEALNQGASEMASGVGPHPAADPSRARDGGYGWETRWVCVRGEEAGKTFLVACRATMLKKIQMLLWRKRADGKYIDRSNGARVQKNATSRVLVAAVTLKTPWCGMSMVTVCNCHLHRLLAKQFTGFADFHKCFWD